MLENKQNSENRNVLIFIINPLQKVDGADYNKTKKKKANFTFALLCFT
ncbi:hypothetical protein AAUPMC_08882 [Pasteurella multocida subsp. multocida str. Anand1_cattle]|nr:hypothetical protein AAUPMC_08882 [Pasteurella multocida subsp. multocida str. Anand1_cattle]